MDLKPGNFTSQSAREICRDPASESDRFRRQDASRGEWWGLAIAFSPDPELGNRPRRRASIYWASAPRKEPTFLAIILFRLCDGENSRGRRLLNFGI